MTIRPPLSEVTLRKWFVELRDETGPRLLLALISCLRSIDEISILYSAVERSNDFEPSNQAQLYDPSVYSNTM